MSEDKSDHRKDQKNEAQKRYAKTAKGKVSTRRRNLKFWYGITIDTYDEMLRDQKGLCAICSGPETCKNRYGAIARLTIDHNHDTGKVRGLLCRKCNSAIGYFQDQKQMLKLAYKYLEKYDG